MSHRESPHFRSEKKAPEAAEVGMVRGVLGRVVDYFGGSNPKINEAVQDALTDYTDRHPFPASRDRRAPWLAALLVAAGSAMATHEHGTTSTSDRARAESNDGMNALMRALDRVNVSELVTDIMNQSGVEADAEPDSLDGRARGTAEDIQHLTRARVDSEVSRLVRESAAHVSNTEYERVCSELEGRIYDGADRWLRSRAVLGEGYSSRASLARAVAEELRAAPRERFTRSPRRDQ